MGDSWKNMGLVVCAVLMIMLMPNYTQAEHTVGWSFWVGNFGVNYYSWSDPWDTYHYRVGPPTIFYWDGFYHRRGPYFRRPYWRYYRFRPWYWRGPYWHRKNWPYKRRHW